MRSRGPGKRTSAVIGRLATISRPLPLNSEFGAARPVGRGRTEGGSIAQQFAISDLVMTLTASGTGFIVPTIGGANALNIGPNIFNANNALKLLYDRIRLVGATFHFMPAGSLATTGALVFFIDYNADTAVNSLQKALRTQGAVEASPWQTGKKLVWRAQGPNDYSYVSSASTGGFNSDVTAVFQCYGEGLPINGLIGYIHISAILEYTGRQNV